MNKDRAALIGLAAIGLVILAAIAIGAIAWRIPNDSLTLLGAISAGVLLFVRDVVTTIRAAWTDERTGALTDHLAGSTPGGEQATGKQGDPVHMTTEE